MKMAQKHLELFMMDIQVDLDTAKNESGEITG
jgi:hypothetical protein